MGLDSYFWKLNMIDKLYNLKKTQTDQVLIQKGQLQAKIDKIDAEIMFTQNKIDTATLQRFGSVSDFSVLAIHKNTMRLHIQELNNQKVQLEKELEVLIEKIIQLQKETEQYSYILEEEKAEALRQLLLAEQEASEEYIQSKYITG